MQLDTFNQEAWFSYLSEKQQKLVLTSFELLKMCEEHKFFCYGFVVFPASKAYEGFLKKLLLELKLIDETAYKSKYFRLGRALNPDVRESQRDEYWLFDDIAKVCGYQLSRQLWDTWLKCRNRVFHYFPGEEKHVNLEQAESCLNMLTDSMEKAIGCLNKNK